MNIGDNRDPDVVTDFSGCLLIESDQVMGLRILAVKIHSRSNDRQDQYQNDQYTKELPQDWRQIQPNNRYISLCRFLFYKYGISTHVNVYS